MRNALLVLAICIASRGSADLLADLAPPPPSDGACWERAYEDDHLARHPRQKVTEMRFHLQDFQGAYAFNIAIATRERAGELFGYCSPPIRTGRSPVWWLATAARYF